MYIAPLTEALITPSLGSLVGTSASAEVLSYLNSQYGNQSGVIFGQPGDPLMDRFNHLMGLVKEKLVATDTLIKATTQAIVDPYRIQAVVNENQLYNTPMSMQLPILMYAPVRELFEQDRIYGYGYDKNNLPQEDYFGRLVDNGSVVYDKDHYDSGKLPEYMVEEWRSDDPNLTFDDLDAIEQTRLWLAGWLKQQMAEDGEMRDPTDPSNMISKIRRRKVKVSE